VDGKLSYTEINGTWETIIFYIIDIKYFLNPFISFINLFKKNKLIKTDLYIKKENNIYYNGIDWDLYLKFELIRTEIGKFQQEQLNK
jgi:hypothetical protein